MDTIRGHTALFLEILRAAVVGRDQWDNSGITGTGTGVSYIPYDNRSVRELGCSCNVDLANSKNHERVGVMSYGGREQGHRRQKGQRQSIW